MTRPLLNFTVYDMAPQVCMMGPDNQGGLELGFFTNTMFPNTLQAFNKHAYLDTAFVPPALTQSDLRGWAVPNLSDSVSVVPSVALQVTRLLWIEG